MSKAKSNLQHFRALQAEAAKKIASRGTRIVSFYELDVANWYTAGWPRPNPGPAPKSVAICGKDVTQYLAPWGTRGWEFWGMNETERQPPLEAHTRWFQVHPPRYLEKHYKPGLADLSCTWRTDRGIRLYMDRHYDEYPNSEAYPKEEVEALVPHGKYHTSSFDWMVALAILEGFKKIAVYGMGFVQPPLLTGEPISGRPCFEYWAGVAEGRGATVEVYGQGDVFRTVHYARYVSDLQYGWDDEPVRDLGAPWQDMR